METNTSKSQFEPHIERIKELLKDETLSYRDVHKIIKQEIGLNLRYQSFLNFVYKRVPNSPRIKRRSPFKQYEERIVELLKDKTMSHFGVYKIIKQEMDGNPSYKSFVHFIQRIPDHIKKREFRRRSQFDPYRNMIIELLKDKTMPYSSIFEVIAKEMGGNPTFTSFECFIQQRIPDAIKKRKCKRKSQFDLYKERIIELLEDETNTYSYIFETIKKEMGSEPSYRSFRDFVKKRIF